MRQTPHDAFFTFAFSLMSIQFGKFPTFGFCFFEHFFKMKNLLHRLPFWLISFAIIFLFTQSCFFPQVQPIPSLFGLPNWLYLSMAIHVLFILTFYFFTKKYWKE